MRIYHPLNKQHQTLVTPANDTEGGIDSEWLDENGDPKMIAVNFGLDGSVEVPDALGRYMIARGYAKRTRLIIPKSVQNALSISPV